MLEFMMWESRGNILHFDNSRAMPGRFYCKQHGKGWKPGKYKLLQSFIQQKLKGFLMNLIAEQGKSIIYRPTGETCTFKGVAILTILWYTWSHMVWYYFSALCWVTFNDRLCTEIGQKPTLLGVHVMHLHAY